MVLPRHVSIIMDGNRRWATERGMAKVAGHLEGIKRVREIVQVAVELKLEVLSLYAFSLENWQRSEEEVSFLWQQVFTRSLKKELDLLNNYEVRLKLIGNFEYLNEGRRKKLTEIEQQTENNKGLKLVVALSYSGRWDIIQAAKQVVTQPNFEADNFPNYLTTCGLPDPDLMIRTGGEKRISNFMLWQLAYTELYFVDKYWPDFSKQDFCMAVEDYQYRQRRFGKC